MPSSLMKDRPPGAYILSPQQIPPRPVPRHLSEVDRQGLLGRIRTLLKRQNAVLVAHYYTNPDLQDLADATGGCVSDSLDMARFGNQSEADTLVVCGVRFMGETAKILNPEKCVLMPDLAANCSLDIACPIDQFSVFCDQHPDRTVVVYANTSAAVKARADWVVTSGSAIDVVNYLKDNGEKIIWAPDRYLGQYVQEQTGADMLLWQGSCVVHEEFKGLELLALKKKYPHAKVLVHPESPASVIELADVVGSTTRLIAAARELATQVCIVATDKGIFHKMQQAAPEVRLIEAPTAGHGASCISCGHCPWMAMNDLSKLEQVLTTRENAICVDPQISQRAVQSIMRLLRFTQDEKKLAGDA